MREAYGMKYTNVQWILKAPLYIRKPHKCPDCKKPVSVAKREKVVRAGSEEAKQMGVTRLCGNVKVVWKVFEGPSCGKMTTIDEMKHHEGIPK
jgi:hypothetical protein